MNAVTVNDLKILVQFAKDQGWDDADVMEAAQRVEQLINDKATGDAA